MLAPNSPALPDIRTVIGDASALRQVTKNELAGPCPQCGGVDRFRVSLSRNLCVCSHCHERNSHWLTRADFIMWMEGKTYPEAMAKLEGTPFALPPAIQPALPHQAEDRGPIVNVYDYTDESGAILYQACRHDPKAFSQRRPATQTDIERAKNDRTWKIWKHGNGSQWLWHLDDARRVLYRLPELLARPDATVFLPEGEKDADTVAALGFIATTNAGGAGNWRQEYTEQLRGRHVALLSDKDKAGAQRTALISRELMGAAASLVSITLPGPGKDVTDWVVAGGTRAELEQLTRDARAALRTPKKIFPNSITADLLVKKEFPPLRWLVEGILPEGASLFSAPPKTGKSVTMIGIGIAVASGGAAFGHIKVSKARVMYITFEEPEELMQERLITMCRGKAPSALFDFSYEPLPVPDLLERVEAYVAEFPQTGLVVIDTLAGSRSGRRRANKDISQEDYDDLIRYSHLAHKLHIAIVIITHSNKGMHEDELAEVAGSYGLSGAVDAILMLKRQRYSPTATLGILARRLKSERKLDLRWDELIQSYVYEGDTPPERARATTSNQIIDALRHAGRPMSPKDIAADTELAYDVVCQRLHHLKKAGEVEALTHGLYQARKERKERKVTPETDENIRKHDVSFEDDDDGFGGEYEAQDYDELTDNLTTKNGENKSNLTELTDITQDIPF